MASSFDGQAMDTVPPDVPNVDNTSISSTATSRTANTSDKRQVEVKFEFKVTNSDADSFPAPTIHRNLLLLLEKAYPNTTIKTNTSSDIIPSFALHHCPNHASDCFYPGCFKQVIIALF